MSNVFEALRKHYVAPSWAYFEEVRSATGYTRKERYADGVAMGLWPSRGMEVHGVEVKTSRNDWLKELKRPEKAEPIFQYCDRWWIAISDKEIVKNGELPSTWGLYVLNGRGLKVARSAPQLKAKPLDRTFIASILRRANEAQQKMLNNIVEPIVNIRVEERLESLKTTWMYDQAHEQQQIKSTLEELQVAVRTFEEASGIQIRQSWQAGQLGCAVKEVLACQDVEHRFQSVRRTIEQILNHIDSISSK